jgi:hypothetical protein
MALFATGFTSAAWTPLKAALIMSASAAGLQTLAQ